jgi:hypothetical protein
MGTQAAAEFVCRASDVESILDALPNKGKLLGPFEVVIRVRVSGGVPVSSTIVAVHGAS